ncbi:MAG: hypothetical protein P4L50_30110 [Anaerolineaceae bacterium]|nr:hypothetical protein [Anaerolineaceae bacterium]
MVQSFEILEKVKTVVFQSLTLSLAAVVCDQLERAGTPAQVESVQGGFAVKVPSDCAAQALSLLTGYPNKREIFVEPK